MNIQLWLVSKKIIFSIQLNAHPVRGIILLRAELRIVKARLLVCVLNERAELLVETRAVVEPEVPTTQIMKSAKASSNTFLDCWLKKSKVAAEKCKSIHHQTYTCRNSVTCASTTCTFIVHSDEAGELSQSDSRQLSVLSDDSRNYSDAQSRAVASSLEVVRPEGVV